VDKQVPPGGSGLPHDGRGHGTRERIQQVALELFAEQGYEKTSLREIAERLGVTKAALYYHFRSKEDIVRSLIEDSFRQTDELIEWASGQPRTPDVRGEFLRRYVALVADGSEVFRMLQQNQAAIGSLKTETGPRDMLRQRISGLIGVLAGPGADAEEVVRAAMAVGGISLGLMWCSDRGLDRADLVNAVVSVASELARVEPPAAGPAPRAAGSAAAGPRLAGG
jgi:AcrR family transcriptional regulator